MKRIKNICVISMVILLSVFVAAGCSKGAAAPNGGASSKETENKQTGASDAAESSAAAKVWYTQEEDRTKYGIIILPKLNEEKIPNDGAKKANEMIQEVWEEIVAGIYYWDTHNGEQGATDPYEVFSNYRCALVGDVLSAEIRYQYYYGAPAMQGLSVNIDVANGKLLTPEQVFEKAGFSPAEVRESFTCYASRYTEKYVEYLEKESGGSSAGSGGASDSETLASIKSAVETVQKQYDSACSDGTLCAFMPEQGSLYIMADVPTPGMGEGYWLERIHIGHNDEQTLQSNDFIVPAEYYTKDAGTDYTFEGGNLLENQLKMWRYPSDGGGFDILYKNAVDGTVLPKDGLNVRKGPSEDAEILTALKFNTKIALYGENSSGSGWYMVEVTDKSGNLAKGYVSKELVKCAESEIGK